MFPTSSRFCFYQTCQFDIWHVILWWTRHDTVRHVTSFTKNDKKYGLFYIYCCVPGKRGLQDFFPSPERWTESDAYEPIIHMHTAQVRSKTTHLVHHMIYTPDHLCWSFLTPTQLFIPVITQTPCSVHAHGHASQSFSIHHHRLWLPLSLSRAWDIVGLDGTR